MLYYICIGIIPKNQRESNHYSKEQKKYIPKDYIISWNTNLHLCSTSSPNLIAWRYTSSNTIRGLDWFTNSCQDLVLVATEDRFCLFFYHKIFTIIIVLIKLRFIVLNFKKVANSSFMHQEIHDVFLYIFFTLLSKSRSYNRQYFQTNGKRFFFFFSKVIEILHFCVKDTLDTTSLFLLQQCFLIFITWQTHNMLKLSRFQGLFATDKVLYADHKGLTFSMVQLINDTPKIPPRTSRPFTPHHGCKITELEG